jgi:hypothetical protein
MKQLTIESYGDGAISIAHYPFETHFNKQEVAEIRAYLNKDVIAELERLKEEATNENRSATSYGLRLNRGGRIDMAEVAIALLRGDVK